MCSKHFQLEMRKYKEIHQANENTRKDVGNTPAKIIATTLNHHPVEANSHKAIKGTTLNHQVFSITQDRSTRRKRRLTILGHKHNDA